MKKISAVYKIVNTITGDCYVGSSKNVIKRWQDHKYPSNWKQRPNNKLYQDMQKYGVDRFRFQILAPVMEEYLKQVEQEFIEMIHPTYNNYRANGIDVERQKKSSLKRQKKYQQSCKGRKVARKASKKYLNQSCIYNGEELTLRALSLRFRKAGIEHPTFEAKKYLERNNNEE